MTIGQAFELAYKKFLDIDNKEMEAKKFLLVLQKRVALLERENGILKTRLRDVASIKGQQDVQEYMHRNDVRIDNMHSCILLLQIIVDFVSPKA